MCYSTAQWMRPAPEVTVVTIGRSLQKEGLLCEKCLKDQNIYKHMVDFRDRNELFTYISISLSIHIFTFMFIYTSIYLADSCVQSEGTSPTTVQWEQIRHRAVRRGRGVRRWMPMQSLSADTCASLGDTGKCGTVLSAALGLDYTRAATSMQWD